VDSREYKLTLWGLGTIAVSFGAWSMLGLAGAAAGVGACVVVWAAR
jgi:hypothetical protein